MALEPGDAIPEDACEQVGNFPHGILKNPDDLELDPGVFGPQMCLGSKKQDYIDAFDARDLEVCNESDFAKIHTPYIVKLSRGGDLPPDPDTSEDFHIRFDFAEGQYNVSAIGRTSILTPADYWEKVYSSYFDPAYGGESKAASGSVSFDMGNQPGLTQDSHRIGFGSFYENSAFSCIVQVEYTWTGLNGAWEDMVLQATASTSYVNDAGSSSEMQSGSIHVGTQGVSLYLNSSGSDSQPWEGSNGTGTLNKNFALQLRMSIQPDPF